MDKILTKENLEEKLSAAFSIIEHRTGKPLTDAEKEEYRSAALKAIDEVRES